RNLKRRTTREREPNHNQGYFEIATAPAARNICKTRFVFENKTSSPRAMRQLDSMARRAALLAHCHQLRPHPRPPQPGSILEPSMAEQNSAPPLLGKLKE